MVTRIYSVKARQMRPFALMGFWQRVKPGTMWDIGPPAPLVCPDETSKQLIAETRTPIPMKRGRTARIDYEYERKVGNSYNLLLCLVILPSDWVRPIGRL